MASFMRQILFLTLLLTLQQSLCIRHPEILLFEKRDNVGRQLKVHATYVQNLEVKDFDNLVESVCVNGTWILYEHPNFNNGLQGNVEYVVGKSYCHNLKIVNGQLSSLRFAGSALDVDFDSITLYKNNYFQGAEEYHTASSSDIKFLNQSQSLIVTGSKPWGIFPLTNFGGESVCIQPEGPTHDLSVKVVPNTEMEFGYFGGIIKSLEIMEQCNNGLGLMYYD